ncbi:unnamed protein product, partial [Mesorhabditis spiculigera]
MSYAFNFDAEANPYSRVYDRRRALLGSVLSRPRVPSASRSRSSTSSYNPYESVMRDSTQQFIGTRAEDSKYDLLAVPDQFGGSWGLRDEDYFACPTTQASRSNVKPVGKRLLSAESHADIRALPNLFGPSNSRSAHSPASQDKIIPRLDRHSTREAESNPLLGATRNKRVLTAESQADLLGLPDVFPDARERSARSSRSNRAIGATSSYRIGGLGSASLYDIQMLDNPFETQSQYCLGALNGNGSRSSTGLDRTYNKRLLTAESHADLRALPPIFTSRSSSYYREPLSAASEHQFNTAPSRPDDLGSERFTVSIPIGAGRGGSNQGLPNYFGDNNNSGYELRLRDYSIQSMDDLRRLPDPFAGRGFDDDWAIRTARAQGSHLVSHY